MDTVTSKAAFAVLVRRSGVPLTDEDVAVLYEGYGWLERLVAELDRPSDERAEPATVFLPQLSP